MCTNRTIVSVILYKLESCYTHIRYIISVSLSLYMCIYIYIYVYIYAYVHILYKDIYTYDIIISEH